MASGQEPAAPHSPQRVTSEGGRGEVRPQRHRNGANGARTKHGALVRREYGLLAPEDLAGDPAAADPNGSRDIPKDTWETGRTDGRETGTWERNGQRALLACGQPEDKDEERGTPKRQRTIKMCTNQGGEEGGTPTQQRTITARGQEMEGHTPTRPRTPPVRIQEMEEGETPHTQQRALPEHIQGIEGDTLTRQHAPPFCSQGIEEGRDPPHGSVCFPRAARG